MCVCHIIIKGYLLTYLLFPRTVDDWKSLPATTLLSLLYLPSTSHLYCLAESRDIPAVKGHAHCWVTIEELKNKVGSVGLHTLLQLCFIGCYRRNKPGYTLACQSLTMIHAWLCISKRHDCHIHRKCELESKGAGIKDTRERNQKIL